MTQRVPLNRVFPFVSLTTCVYTVVYTDIHALSDTDVLSVLITVTELNLCKRGYQVYLNVTVTDIKVITKLCCIFMQDLI